MIRTFIFTGQEKLGESDESLSLSFSTKRLIHPDLGTGAGFVGYPTHEDDIRSLLPSLGSRYQHGLVFVTESWSESEGGAIYTQVYRVIAPTGYTIEEI